MLIECRSCGRLYTPVLQRTFPIYRAFLAEFSLYEFMSLGYSAYSDVRRFATERNVLPTVCVYTQFCVEELRRASKSFMIHIEAYTFQEANEDSQVELMPRSRKEYCQLLP